MQKHLTKRARDTIILFVGSGLSFIALFLSLTGFSYSFVDPMKVSFMLMGAFLATALNHFLFAYACKFNDKTNKLYFWNEIGTGIYFVVIGLLSIFIFESDPVFLIVVFAFLFGIIGFRIMNIISKRNVYTIVFNALIILAALAVAIILILVLTTGDPTAFLLAYMAVFMILAITSLKDVLAYVFSRVKGTILKDIIRKTFALEILLGLVILILAFSMVFYMFEDQMKTYVDALWYSFCIVTTIGLGDLTCTSGIGRALSVILGMYGIVVVALITSIIVNFYNEASTRRIKDHVVEIVEDDEGKVKEIVKDGKEIEKEDE